MGEQGESLTWLSSPISLWHPFLRALPVLLPYHNSFYILVKGFYIPPPGAFALEMLQIRLTLNVSWFLALIFNYLTL